MELPRPAAGHSEMASLPPFSMWKQCHTSGISTILSYNYGFWVGTMEKGVAPLMDSATIQTIINDLAAYHARNPRGGRGLLEKLHGRDGSLALRGGVGWFGWGPWRWENLKFFFFLFWKEEKKEK